VGVQICYGQPAPFGVTTYDCGYGNTSGAVAWNYIYAPSWQWGGAEVMGNGFLDPTNYQITPGGFNADGTHLGVCQLYYDNSLQLGKARTYNGTFYCFIGFGGQELAFSQQATDPGFNPTSSPSFKVLFTGSSQSGSWTNVASVDWSKALVGGWDVDGSDLAVCRVWANGALTPGKVLHYSQCNYGFGGVEYIAAYPNFDVYYPPAIPSNPE
jgi:hypothetical protein